MIKEINNKERKRDGIVGTLKDGKIRDVIMEERNDETKELLKREKKAKSILCLD